MQKVKNRKKLENGREKKLLIAPFGPPPLFSYNSVFDNSRHANSN
jgi:hypothetical protein